MQHVLTSARAPVDISWKRGKSCSAFSLVSKSPSTALDATQNVIQRASLNQSTLSCLETLLTLSVIKGVIRGRCSAITAWFDSTCTPFVLL
jgi:hypothetical protein